MNEKYIVIPATTVSYPALQTKSFSRATHLTKRTKLKIDSHLRSSSVIARNHFLKHDKSKNQLLHKADTHYPEFLKIIHNEITSHQQYPYSAILLNQSGTVTLQFSVQPNGQIDQTIILKSSGFFNLDQAALNALQKIGHFKQAYLYLQKTTIFSVDVIFV